MTKIVSEKETHTSSLKAGSFGCRPLSCVTKHEGTGNSVMTAGVSDRGDVLVLREKKRYYY